MSGAARGGAAGEPLAGAADVRAPRAVRGPGGEGAAGEAVEGPRQQPLPRPRRVRIRRRHASGGRVLGKSSGALLRMPAGFADSLHTATLQ